MKTNKEFVKRIIATVQLKILIGLLKVQVSAKLTDKEKDVQKEVNELIPEIYTDEDLKRIISDLLLKSKELKKMLIRLTNYSINSFISFNIRYYICVIVLIKSVHRRVLLLILKCLCIKVIISLK